MAGLGGLPVLVPKICTYCAYFSSPETYPFSGEYEAVLEPYLIDTMNAAATQTPTSVSQQIYAASQKGKPTAFLLWHATPGLAEDRDPGRGAYSGTRERRGSSPARQALRASSSPRRRQIRPARPDPHSTSKGCETRGVRTRLNTSCIPGSRTSPSGDGQSGQCRRSQRPWRRSPRKSAGEQNVRSLYWPQTPPRP